jgi:hypothetical protein
VIVVSAAAQPAARIAGVVRDAEGGILPGVTVTVTQDGVTRGETVADSGGAFDIGGLGPGTYSVTATLGGFRPATKDVRLTDVPGAPVDFTLRLGVLVEVLYALPEPREGHRRADAIGHLQIVATLPPDPCGDIVLALHQVSVVDTWKAGESRTREPVNLYRCSAVSNRTRSRALSPGVSTTAIPRS